jgi:hypothetical protein
MKNTTLLVWLVIVVAMVVFGPFVTIWSLNTIFGLTIEYSIATWFAAVWLQGTLMGGVITTIKNRK